MQGPDGRVLRLSDHLFRFQDTCNVYAVITGREAVVIDFGAGDILDHLEEMGVDRITDVLMTHHHRDQAQGLPRAVEHGARIWVPPVEQDLFAAVDEHWQARELLHDYNTRQDRFSILESVPIAGLLPEYRAPRYGGRRFRILPTPGHTPGSVSFVTRVDGRVVCFSGDLIHSAGKVWSMAATQWTYTGAEGAGMTMLSLLDLKERRPDVLLPSHGAPIEPVGPAIDLLVDRLEKLFLLRGRHPWLLDFRARPYEAITPHLLRNRTSVSTSYVLLSDSGKALFIDYGYDLTTGLAAGDDRAAQRPWLATLEQLRRDFGVERVDVAVPTHYHDDHVAGMNLLHDVLGTRIWAPVNFVDVLKHPTHYSLPCLWFDPISVDRVIPTSRPVAWEEYELTFHPLPGHTLFAVAIGFEVDGLRVLATGDHQQDRWLNYVYANRFSFGDYRESGELYLRLEPDLIVSGHWQPTWVDEGYLHEMLERGAGLERIHEELLPLDELDLEAGGSAVWIGPYQTTLVSGESGTYNLAVRNPFSEPSEARITLVLPEEWSAEPAEVDLRLGAGATATAEFVLTVRGEPRRRARIAADATIRGRRFGQIAEALVTVLPARPAKAEPTPLFRDAGSVPAPRAAAGAPARRRRAAGRDS